MFSTDTAKGEHCKRTDCQPCGMETERKVNCKKQNLVYESYCTICNPVKPSSHQEEKQDEPSIREGIYIGETSRTLFERANEHYKDAWDFSEKSHMLKHWMSSHADLDQVPEFRFKILGTFCDCLSRQVSSNPRTNF